MGFRLAVVALSTAVLGLGLVPVTAHADANSENAWSPSDYRLGADDMDAWETTMSAWGKGVVFSGRQYRDFDAITGTWGSWKRLHVKPERMLAKGNARGDVCTAWSASFGVAIACRTTGAQTWPKTNLIDSRDAYVNDLAISSDGKRALIVWGDNSTGQVRQFASIYTLATKTVRTTQLRGIPGGAPQEYFATPSRLGRMSGFALAYRTGDDRLWGDATYYRLYRPGQGWSQQARLQLGTPARDVVMSDMASDGVRTYAVVSPDIPVAPLDYPAAWWVTELGRDGTFSRPEEAAGQLEFPVIAASGTSVTIAAVNPNDNALVISTSTDFIDSPFQIANIPSPQVADTVGRLTDLAIVGQRDATGDFGYALIAQYTGVSNPGDEAEDDVDQLFTLTGFDVAGRSALTRLGTHSGYEGMNADLAGYGRFAMTVYAAGLEIYAGARVPADL